MSDSHKKVVMKPVWPKVARYSSPEEILLETPSDEEEERCMSITHPPTSPTREMSRLSLQSSRVRKAVRPTPAPSAVTGSTRSAPLPTWGQMKKLIQVADHRLQEGRLPKTDVNLMLSMMAVLTVTRTPWSEVRAHLLGHTPNLSVDIQQLQQEIDQMSSANLQLLPGEEALSAAAEGLSTLNPLTWIKSLGGGFAGAFVFLIIILFLFCLVLRCGQKSLRRAINEETAKSVFLLLHKQKGGDVALQLILRPPPLH
ncbi:uncharacterized protein RBU33_016339 [Hipposideros larvatus]